MKRYIIIFAFIFSMTVLTACGDKNGDELVLRVANCEEYIDEGDWDDDEAIELSDGTVIFGENPLVSDFEKWYEDTYGQAVRVEYSTYGTNEDLYNQMRLGDVFDVVCPSEYMILKLLEEDRLMPFSEEFFDESDPNNYYAAGVSEYIDDVLKSLATEDGNRISDYGAGYMWGTLGIVYNPDEVSEEAAGHYFVLNNRDYYKQITMKDSIRDAYFAGLAILNEDRISDEAFISSPAYRDELSAIMNDTSEDTVKKVEGILSDMRDNAYSLETDSGKADLVTGKVKANLQWSGDAVYTMDQAEEDGVYLCYSAPEECVNLWFDGWVMMKNGIAQDARKQQAAEAFINYISRPESVIRNMYFIGYTSAIAASDDGRVFEYLKYNYEATDDEEGAPYDVTYFFGTKEDDESYVLYAPRQQQKRQLYAQYPTEDVLSRSVVMRCFDTAANERIAQMWTDIRCFDLGWGD